jgi:hypothetical protein
MDGRWLWGDCVKVMGRLREVVVGRFWEGYGEVEGSGCGEVQVKIPAVVSSGC